MHGLLHFSNAYHNLHVIEYSIYELMATSNQSNFSHTYNKCSEKKIKILFANVWLYCIYIIDYGAPSSAAANDSTK